MAERLVVGDLKFLKILSPMVQDQPEPKTVAAETRALALVGAKDSLVLVGQAAAWAGACRANGRAATAEKAPMAAIWKEVRMFG